jgi:ribonuclease HI
MSKYYAVKKGHFTGIFRTWKECEQSIKGYNGAKYKSFLTKTDATNYLQDTKSTIQSTKQSYHGILYTDGASRRNPGHASFGGVLYVNNNIVSTFYHYLGSKKTNMEAEYHGLCEGLLLGKMIGLHSIEVYVDNQTIVKQLNGEFQCRSENLIDLYRNSLDILRSFHSFSITHIYRVHNKKADELANIALDTITSKLDIVPNVTFLSKEYTFPYFTNKNVLSKKLQLF